MDMHALAERIATEIAARLMPHLASHAGTGIGSAGVCVRVLGERNEEVDTRLRSLIPGALLVFDKETPPKTPERHILPKLGLSDMAALACGMAPTPLSQEVLHLLTRGIAIEVLDFEYLAIRETAPTSLWQLYESYEQTLAGFRLTRCQARQDGGQLRLNDGLITEGMVTKAASEGVHSLIITTSALITPLAADAAANLQITFRRQ